MSRKRKMDNISSSTGTKKKLALNKKPTNHKMRG